MVTTGHAHAMLMVENCADIRFIQQMLGRAKLETTEITPMSRSAKLKAIHESTHPVRMHSETAEIRAELADMDEVAMAGCGD